MANSLERHREGTPSDRWIGDIREITDDDFTAILWSDYGDGGEEMGGIIVPHANIYEVERPKIVRGALFFCDVKTNTDGTFDLLGIEFEEGLTARLMQDASRELGELFRKAEERERNRIAVEE